MEHAPEERRVDPNVRAARQHARTARNEMRMAWEAWLPPGVVEHQHAARREFLLAVRSIVNAAIEHLDEHIGRTDSVESHPAAPPADTTSGSRPA